MKQPGHAEQRIRTENQRVEKIIVHAPVDHIGAPQSRGGAHVNETVVDQEVIAFDQFRTNLASQKHVLVEGRVVDAGSQQRDAGVGPPSRGQLLQGLEQMRP